MIEKITDWAKTYSRINWENKPSTNTALGATNLNKMDLALNEIDNRVVTLGQQKLDKDVANNMVSSWSMNENTGVITVTLLDGTTTSYDLNIEKIPASLELTSDGILKMTTDDGEVYTADLSSLIREYTFQDSSTIAFTASAGTNSYKEITASIKAGSITDNELSSTLIDNLQQQVASATQSASDADNYAKLSKRYAVGGVVEGDDTDNAKYYYEKTKEESSKVDIDIATETRAGIVKASGDITVDEGGAMGLANSIKAEIETTSSAISTHIADNNNPHETTAAQVGAAKQSEHNIRTHTRLEQIGLSDSDLSATDFKANMDTICNALESLYNLGLGGFIEFALYVNTSTNFSKSLCLKLDTDLSKTYAAGNNIFYFFVRGHYGARSRKEITVLVDSGTVFESYKCMYDKQGENPSVISAFIYDYLPAGFLPLLDGIGPHNATYRGKALGSVVTAEQWAAIANGTFTDLYIGDYWTIGGINYRIAAFDYYLRSGDTDTTTHHVTLVPDTNMYTHVMNDTNTTEGAYVGSKMYTEGLAQAKTTINNAFGAAHILKHRRHLQNAVTNGYSIGGAWYDSTVELMTEQNVYGGVIFGNCENGTAWPNLYTNDKSQYPLFAMRPDMISARNTFWLRDVASASVFCNVAYNGNANANHASLSRGVRPAFSIKS